MDDDVTAGSWRAILHELRHGNFWTVVDEFLHVLDFTPIGNATWRARFCFWAHRNDQ